MGGEFRHETNQEIVEAPPPTIKKYSALLTKLLRGGVTVDHRKKRYCSNEVFRLSLHRIKIKLQLISIERRHGTETMKRH